MLRHMQQSPRKYRPTAKRLFVHDNGVPYKLWVHPNLEVREKVVRAIRVRSKPWAVSSTRLLPSDQGLLHRRFMVVLSSLRIILLQPHTRSSVGTCHRRISGLCTTILGIPWPSRTTGCSSVSVLTDWWMPGHTSFGPEGHPSTLIRRHTRLMNHLRNRKLIRSRGG